MPSSWGPYESVTPASNQQIIPALQPVRTTPASQASRRISSNPCTRQIASIQIFTMFIYGTLLFGEFRLAFAFGGIALLMICNLITVDRFTLTVDSARGRATLVPR